jgi:hypothetical protein
MGVCIIQKFPSQSGIELKLVFDITYNFPSVSVGRVNPNYCRDSAGLSTYRVSVGSTEYCRLSAGLTNKYNCVAVITTEYCRALPS